MAVRHWTCSAMRCSPLVSSLGTSTTTMRRASATADRAWRRASRRCGKATRWWPGSSTDLGRDLHHLVNLVHELTGRGVGLKILTGQGAQLHTTTANGRLVFAIFAALAEFEHALIVERTRAGLVSARARGRNGGRPFKMTAAKLRLAQAAMGKPGTKVSELCAELGITRQTLYRHVDPNGLLRPDGKKLLGRTRARSSAVPAH